MGCFMWNNYEELGQRCNSTDEFYGKIEMAFRKILASMIDDWVANVLGEYFGEMEQFKMHPQGRNPILWTIDRMFN